jgi:PAS domain S-box-containing protein
VAQGHEESLSRVLACISDITERKRFEAALQSSEERYRIVADFTYSCEYWQAPDGRFLYVSPSCETQTGYRPEDFFDFPDLISRIVHPDDVAMFEFHMQGTREAPDPANIDFRIVRRDGSILWVNHLCRPVYGRGGEYLGRRISNRDITERKELEARLADAAAYARGLFEVNLDPMATISPDGRITDVNQGAEKAMGLTREQLIGTDYVDYCTEPEKARQAFLQVLTAGFARDVALSIRSVSGTVTEFLFNGVELRNKNGQVQGIFISAREVTELKRLERALRELNESLEHRIEQEVARSHEKDQLLIDQAKQAATELQAVNENLERLVQAEVAASRDKDHMLIQQSRLAAMGEMVHNIAHQWRQPLHGVSLILGNLRDSYALRELTPETLDGAIQRAQTLLQGMSKTIDDFRDFFRPDRTPVEFDVSESVKDALLIMEATLKNNNIEVAASLPAGLKTYGHPSQFAQAVLNVIANAKEAIQQQNVSDGRIEISLVRSDDRGILTIQDNGGGIPQEILPRIFDPYFTTKDQGSGIGLYMTKTIVERNLKGAIEAANWGAGARITLSLPLVTEGIQS